MRLKYLANWTVGSFNVGDEVEGLDAERIAELLKIGAVKSYEVEDVPEDPKPKRQRAQKDD